MTTQYDLKVPPQKAENIKDEKIISPPPSLSPSKQKTLSWQWFHNLPIQRKQLISLLATEVISVVGLVGVGTGLMIAGGRAQLLSQAKSELAVSELYYQMGADSRQQIENAAIIEAARNYAQGQPLSLALKDQLRQILRNETASKQIEYATLVGKDLRIIANANADRTGEKFDPDGIVASVFKNSQQLKVSAIVNWNELQKEAPPLPKGFANSDALIRYTVTPVRDPQTREVIGALVFGDIVNSKLPIVENSLQTLEKGYSALYLSAPSGKYILATSVGKNTNNESPQVNQPLTDITLLKSAVAAKGQTVTQRVQAGEHTYGMAAKALSDVNGKPIAVLVRGTPEASLNEILKSNLLLQWSIAAIAIIAQTALAIALGRTITQPVNQLRKSTQNFLKGDRQARAEICGPDELGELGSTFNQLADRIVGFENKLSQQARRLTTVAERSRLLNNIIANVRRSLKEEEILNTAVSELRHLLNTDRVIVYRFHDDWNGTIIAESVVAGCRQILGQVVNDPFREGLIDLYRNGRVRAMNDIYAEGLTNCHRDILENFQIRASIVAPILYQGKLTGLLCAHHCSAPRHWEKEDIDLVAQLSIQLGFALDQASLLQHQKMTAKYAEQLNAITYRMRCSFTREQVFQECVLGTRAALDVDRTIVYLFDENLSGTVVAESVVQGWPAALGATIADPCFANGYVEKYQQGRIQATYNIYTAGLTECHLNQLAAFEVKANLVAPILSEGKLLGLLICHQCSGPRDWQDTEINLMRQIAMQLDFALEQANLLEQREQARLQAEALFEEQLQQREAIHQQLIHLIGNIEGVYRGDLTVRAEVTAGEIGTVADFFNSIVESLGQIVTKVKQSAVQVNSSLGENEGAIRQLAEVALKQAAETTRTLNSIEQMTQSIQVVAQSARQAAEVARSASLTAEEGEMAMDLTVENILSLRETVAQTAKKVKRLGEASQQISKVVSLINQIAMQTNLLAINAGIEAARAGEEGQGFAVVAEEVGALAARSAGATQEIERIVEDIQRETAQVVEAMEQSTTQVVKGTSLVKDTKQSLGQILDVSRQIDQLVQSISSATVSQVQTAQAVSSLMKEIAQVSEGTADSSRSVSHSLRQTVEIAQELQKSVGTFKVS